MNCDRRNNIDYGFCNDITTHELYCTDEVPFGAYHMGFSLIGYVVVNWHSSSPYSDAYASLYICDWDCLVNLRLAIQFSLLWYATK